MSVKTEDDVTTEESMDVQICANGAEYDRSELPELLRIYYSKLFPYDKYFDWLQYGEKRVNQYPPSNLGNEYHFIFQVTRRHFLTGSSPSPLKTTST